MRSLISEALWAPLSSSRILVALSRTAIAAATWGVAMDVPLKAFHFPLETDEKIATPGALSSGFRVREGEVASVDVVRLPEDLGPTAGETGHAVVRVGRPNADDEEVAARRAGGLPAFVADRGHDGNSRLET